MRLRTSHGRYDVPLTIKTTSTVIMANQGELSGSIEQSVALEMKPVTVDIDDKTAAGPAAAEMTGGEQAEDSDSDATQPI